MKRLAQAAFAVGFAAASLAFVGSASAESAQPNCGCVVPAGMAGSVVSATGDVRISGKAGYVKASVGSPLAAGSKIMVGPQSSAQVAMGNCQLSLLEGSTTTIAPVKGGLCVATSAPGLGGTIVAGGSVTSTGSASVGEGPMGGSFLANPIVPVAIITTAIAIPVAVTISEDNTNRNGVSP